MQRIQRGSKNIMNFTFKPKGLLVVLHLVVGVAIWIGCQMIASISVLISQEIVAMIISVCIQLIFTSLFLSIYCKRVLHIPLGECRIKLILPQPVWLICGILLPIAVSAFFFLFVPGTFAHNNLNSAQMALRLVTAVLATCITASTTEEMVFRGFAMKIIEARYGRLCAIILPSVAFAAFHLVGIAPNFLDIVQLIVAGSSVGILFSLICYESGSIWSNVFVHGMWNLMILGGIIDIGTVHSTTAIFTYTIANDSQLLTGGSFGIESSVPAIISYWCVILIALLLLKSKQNRDTEQRTS